MAWSMDLIKTQNVYWNNSLYDKYLKWMQENQSKCA
jgi:hypothetical protein